MTDQLRKIIRPKPYLVSLELIIFVLFNVLALGFYINALLAVITLTTKAQFVFWVAFLVLNHLLLTLIIDSITAYLTAGYELKNDSLIIVKSPLLTKPQIETVLFENIKQISKAHKSKIELSLRNEVAPKICHIMSNGDVLCAELKEHTRVQNLSILNDNPQSDSSSLLNTPRFIIVDNESLTETVPLNQAELNQ